MSGVPYAVTLVTAVGCGLVAGVFFAFSTFVMPALRRVTPSGGVEAMQSINRVALTPPFMIALFGTALAALGLIVWSVVSSADRPTALIVAGGGLYLVGTIGVTIAGNVPIERPAGEGRFRAGHQRRLARLGRPLERLEPRPHRRRAGCRRAADGGPGRLDEQRDRQGEPTWPEQAMSS